MQPGSPIVHLQSIQLLEVQNRVIKEKDLRQLSFLTTNWAIYKERDQSCFEGKPSTTTDVIARTRFSVASWFSILPDFQGYAYQRHLV